MAKDFRSQLDDLIRPRPLISDRDQDDDLDAHEFSKLHNQGAVASSDEETFGQSVLRTRSAPLLDSLDKRYKGKAVRRSDYVDAYDLKGMGSDDRGKGDFGSESDSSVETDQTIQTDSGEEMTFMASDDEQGSSEASGDESEVERVTLTSKEVSGDLGKAKAVQLQVGTWDALLESRIHTQQLCTLIQRLPRADDWPRVLSAASAETKKLLNQAQRQIQKVLDAAWEYQTNLLASHPATRSLDGDKVHPHSDEEITSESETEEQEKEKVAKSEGLKRPSSLHGYVEPLSKRHASLEQWRDKTLDSVYEKTKLLQKKGFAAFEKKPSLQLSDRLRNKAELLQKTRKPRGLVKIIGETEHENDEDHVSLDERVDLFDDSDFYHALLKQLIDSKSNASKDPAAWTKQYMELQKLRNKQKRKVDTKASKGRKLRYTVHQKLVSFMAAEERGSWSESARDELFSSLFGQRYQQQPVS